MRRRRQDGARGLCFGARPASIETLIDGMLRDISSCYAALHPSSPAGSRQASRKTSITSAPTSMTAPLSRANSADTTSDGKESDEGLHATPAKPRLAMLRFGSGVAAAARWSGGIEKSGSRGEGKGDGAECC